MATLSLIAEPFPDWEAPLHRAAAVSLAEALADTAPRSCSCRVLTARGGELPPFSSPKIAVEQMPMRANMLPILWQSHTSARPLDGEMTHAITPLIPLRSRTEDDGTQTSVTVPNAIAFEHPELLTPAQARNTRAFIKRATRFADVIVTTSHATAAVLEREFGPDLPLQVLPPVAPAALLAGVDASERRARLGLPERYLITTANLDRFGRLQWVFDALEADPALPHVVAIADFDPVEHVKGAPEQSALTDAIPPSLRGRVTVVSAADLADVGAVISGAMLLLQPQSFDATGYALAAAFMAGVPVLHAGTSASTEHVVDAGIAEPEQEGFAAALSRLCGTGTGAGDTPAAPGAPGSALGSDSASGSAPGSDELERLAIRAADRGRFYSWDAVAWQLWEIHALI